MLAMEASSWYFRVRNMIFGRISAEKGRILRWIGKNCVWNVKNFWRIGQNFLWFGKNFIHTGKISSQNLNPNCVTGVCQRSKPIMESDGLEKYSGEELFTNWEEFWAKGEEFYVLAFRISCFCPYNMVYLAGAVNRICRTLIVLKLP